MSTMNQQRAAGHASTFISTATMKQPCPQSKKPRAVGRTSDERHYHPPPCKQQIHLEQRGNRAAVCQPPRLHSRVSNNSTALFSLKTSVLWLFCRCVKYGASKYSYLRCAPTSSRQLVSLGPNHWNHVCTIADSNCLAPGFVVFFCAFTDHLK